MILLTQYSLSIKYNYCPLILNSKIIMLCYNCGINTFCGPCIQREIITDIFITRCIVRDSNNFVLIYLKRITLVKYVDFVNTEHKQYYVTTIALVLILKWLKSLCNVNIIIITICFLLKIMFIMIIITIHKNHI